MFPALWRYPFSVPLLGYQSDSSPCVLLPRACRAFFPTNQELVVVVPACPNPSLIRIGGHHCFLPLCLHLSVWNESKDGIDSLPRCMALRGTQGSSPLATPAKDKTKNEGQLHFPSFYFEKFRARGSANSDRQQRDLGIYAPAFYLSVSCIEDQNLVIFVVVLQTRERASTLLGSQIAFLFWQ